MAQFAVDEILGYDVTFDVHKNETFGLVGESRCGKSTPGRVILRLHESTSGKVFFGNINLGQLKPEELSRFRTKMQIVFQDSYSSLNPRHKVGEIIAEPMTIHSDMNQREIRERILELLKLVGLKSGHAVRFPHKFYGGQRQRINIARTLALYPEFIVCDEPISALDVSIQAQVVNLLKDYSKSLVLPICLLLTILAWFAIFLIVLLLCTWGKSWNLPQQTSFLPTPCILIHSL